MKLIQAYLWEQSQWRALNRQKHVVYLVLPYYQEVVILFDISEKPGMFSQQLNKLPYSMKLIQRSQTWLASVCKEDQVRWHVLSNFPLVNVDRFSQQLN